MPEGVHKPVDDILVSALSLAVGALVLLILVRFLGRTRPGLPLAWPIATAFVVRILVSIFLAVSGGESVRGGDEATFLFQADAIAREPFGSELWSDAVTGHLHLAIFAFEFLVLDPPEVSFRFVQSAIGLAGLALLATAVFDLAGRRAALVACWLIVLEPATLFFGEAIHKESNMLLASGLIALGGVRMWRTGALWPLIPMAVGCVIGLATRQYAGWFLMAAVGLIVFHSAIRHRRRGYAQSVAFVSLIGALGAMALPFAFGLTNEASLSQLQAYQAGTVSSTSANLGLDQVNFSSSGQVVRNLPQRIRAMMTRPYLWELDNTAQQMGLLGTMAVLATIAALGRELYFSRGKIMDRAGPLIYLGLMLMVAYSLSSGNAGTMFRYRIHVVVIGICVAVTLWDLRTRGAPAARRYRAVGVPATSS